MANNIVVNPILCDTAGLLVSGSGSISSIVFVNIGADADITLALTDGTSDGSVKYLIELELTAEQKTAVIAYPKPLTFQEGLWCKVIDGGLAMIQV